MYEHILYINPGMSLLAKNDQTWTPTNEGFFRLRSRMEGLAHCTCNPANFQKWILLIFSNSWITQYEQDHVVSDFVYYCGLFICMCVLRNAPCLSHYRTTVEVCRKPSTAAKNKRGTFMIVTGVGRNIVVRKEWSKSILRLYFFRNFENQSAGQPPSQRAREAW